MDSGRTFSNRRAACVKSRGYALAAIITLAFGIGANAAVFDLSNWLLLRPLPGVRAQRQLITLGFTSGNGARGPVSVVGSRRAQRPASRPCPGLPVIRAFLFTSHPAADCRDGSTRRSSRPAYFDVLDGAVSVGRAFSDDEGRNPGAAPVAIISDRLWTTDLGGDASVLGRSIAVNGHPFAVIGVTTRGFHGTTLGGATDVWIPIAQHRLALPQYPAPSSPAAARRCSSASSAGSRPGRRSRSSPSKPTRSARESPTPIRRTRASRSGCIDVHAGVESRPWIQSRVSYAMSVLTGVVGLLLAADRGKCGQPHARTRDGTAGGNRHATGARRLARPSRPALDRRKSAAVSRRRRDGALARLVDDARARRHRGPAGPSAAQPARNRLARPWLRHPHLNRRRACRRRHTRALGQPSGHERRAAAIRPRAHGRTPATAAGADRRASRGVGHVAGRRSAAPAIDGGAVRDRRRIRSIARALILGRARSAGNRTARAGHVLSRPCSIVSDVRLASTPPACRGSSPTRKGRPTRSFGPPIGRR